jgi:hypothetical protein
VEVRLRVPDQVLDLVLGQAEVQQPLAGIIGQIRS